MKNNLQVVERHAPRDDLDRLTKFQKLDERCAAFNVSSFRRLEDKFDQMLRDFRAAQEPATTSEIADRIALLMVSFPNASKGDLKGYGAILMEDVARKFPSKYALEHACRSLRGGLKFLPTIAEVLCELEMVGRELAARISFLEELPVRVVDAERARERAEEAEALRRREIQLGVLPPTKETFEREEAALAAQEAALAEQNRRWQEDLDERNRRARIVNDLRAAQEKKELEDRIAANALVREQVAGMRERVAAYMKEMKEPAVGEWG